MREERLLERIAQWESGAARTNQTSVDQLVRSILRHLRGILNTQRGSVPIDPEYGIPDLSNLAPSFSPTSIEEVRDDLVKAIEKYEPRLKVRTITLIPNESDVLTLRFEVAGTVEVDDREVPIRLATVVNPEGKVVVRS